MSSVEVVEAVRAFLEANYTELPLVFENETQSVPEDGSAFVFVGFRGGLFDRASIGALEGAEDANIWREEGTLLLEVNSPSGAGPVVARQYARTLCNIFRARQIGAISFSSMSLGAAERSIEGNYWPFIVAIDYLHDTYGV